MDDARATGASLSEVAFESSINSSLVHATASRAAGMTESAAAAVACGEFPDYAERRLRHRREHELRNALAGGDGIRHLPAIPARDHQRSLVIRIDQADQVAEHDAVLVTQPRARQDHRAVARVADVNGDAGRDQGARAGFKRKRRVEYGTQVHAGRSRR